MWHFLTSIHCKRHDLFHSLHVKSSSVNMYLPTQNNVLWICFPPWFCYRTQRSWNDLFSSFQLHFLQIQCWFVQFGWFSVSCFCFSLCWLHCGRSLAARDVTPICTNQVATLRVCLSAGEWNHEENESDFNHLGKNYKGLKIISPESAS